MTQISKRFYAPVYVVIQTCQFMNDRLSDWLRCARHNADKPVLDLDIPLATTYCTNRDLVNTSLPSAL